MAGFPIVANISSLIAQENLIKTNNLQQRTITRLTSGLRINSSADDAAGLAIANRFRSDIAVLRQGIRNAADGLSTLQTIDGGLNNISLLIDRARTLATQSASGTFTGDRSTLNTEFQSVLTEIDRQAQSVGLDPGGAFSAALSVFIGGSVESIAVAADGSGTLATRVDVLNAAIAANATLASAGLVASNSGGAIRLESTNGSLFQLNVDDTNGGFGFSTFTVDDNTNALTVGAGFLETTFNSGGADASTIGDVTSYADIVFGGDDQTITLTANDATGAQQSINITLANDGTGTITSLDEAVQYLNAQLQESNNTTLQSIVAVKERNDASDAEGIRFISTLLEFRVSIGTTENGGGLNGGTAQLLTSDELTGGSVADISSKDNAESAVTLLATAVTVLARIQADVGKGQNNLTFAIGLASTQITNLAAAESRVRDADLAAEAANLTRASIAQQAGVAALAQANSAPQAVLALLRG